MQLAEMEAIANDPAPPTFENTIEAMEQIGRAADARRQGVLQPRAVEHERDDPEGAGRVAPKLAAHQDAIYLNPKLFARVKALYDARATLGLDPEAKRLRRALLPRTSCAPARCLTDADKATLRALNEEESKLTTEFQTSCSPTPTRPRSSSTTRSSSPASATPTSPPRPRPRRSASSTASGCSRCRTRRSSRRSSSLTDRARARSSSTASTHRGDHGDANDTRAIIPRLAQLRAERAEAARLHELRRVRRSTTRWRRRRRTRSS